MRAVALIVCAGTMMCGCAYTHVERSADGSFSYTSTRDSSVGGLRVTRGPNGALELELNGAEGRASSVIDSQAAFLQALIDAAFAAGARAAEAAVGGR